MERQGKERGAPGTGTESFFLRAIYVKILVGVENTSPKAPTYPPRNGRATGVVRLSVSSTKLFACIHVHNTCRHFQRLPLVSYDSDEQARRLCGILEVLGALTHSAQVLGPAFPSEVLGLTKQVTALAEETDRSRQVFFPSANMWDAASTEKLEPGSVVGFRGNALC